MSNFNDVLDKAKDFITDNAGLIAGGIGGSTLGGLAAYNMYNDDDQNATPSEKLKKRMQYAALGALLGGVAGGGAGYVLHKSDPITSVKDLYSNLIDDSLLDKANEKVWDAAKTTSGGYVGAWLGNRMAGVPRPGHLLKGKMSIPAILLGGLGLYGGSKL